MNARRVPLAAGRCPQSRESTSVCERSEPGGPNPRPVLVGFRGCGYAGLRGFAGARSVTECRLRGSSCGAFFDSCLLGVPTVSVPSRVFGKAGTRGHPAPRFRLRRAFFHRVRRASVVPSLVGRRIDETAKEEKQRRRGDKEEKNNKKGGRKERRKIPCVAQFVKQLRLQAFRLLSISRRVFSKVTVARSGGPQRRAVAASNGLQLRRKRRTRE